MQDAQRESATFSYAVLHVSIYAEAAVYVQITLRSNAGQVPVSRGLLDRTVIRTALYARTTSGRARVRVKFAYLAYSEDLYSAMLAVVEQGF